MARVRAACILLAGLVLSLHAPPAQGSGNSGKRALTGAAAARLAKARAARLRIRRPFKRDAAPLGAAAIATFNVGGGHYKLVAQPEYDDLRNSVKDLLQRFPPEESFFVGLGRDPTPIIAFLQELGGEELARNFPGASGKGWKAPEVYNSAQWAIFEKYFEAYIPDEVWKGDRDIVLIDQTNSGINPRTRQNRSGTLGQFAPLFQRYAREHGFKGRIRMAAFSALRQVEGIEQIDTRKYPATAKFLRPPYEGVMSEFARHSINGAQFYALNPRAEYTQFRRALRERMVRDADLDAFLGGGDLADLLDDGDGDGDAAEESSPAVAETERKAPAPNLGATRAPAPTPPRVPPPAPAPRPLPKPWKPTLTMQFGSRTAPGAGALVRIKNPAHAKAVAKAARRAAKRTARGDGDGDGDGGIQEPPTFDYLDATEYGQIRAAAQKLMTLHGPQQSFYVGVGRTSTSMVAFLENVGNDVATYLPADGLHRIAGKTATQKLDNVTRKRFQVLFDAFLPARALDGQRDIVLFHQSDTGSSLPFLQAVLTDYLKTKGSPAQVRIVAFAKGAPASGVPHIDISDSPQLLELNAERAKAISPHGYFRPGKSAYTDIIDRRGAPNPRNGTYDTFKTSLAQRMRADAVLGSRIAQLFTSGR